MGRVIVIALGTISTTLKPALAAAVSCAGMALSGGAQILCSNIGRAPAAQSCTFQWTLQTVAGAPRVVEGAFQLPAHAQNLSVYQASGFALATSPPIILCQLTK